MTGFEPLNQKELQCEKTFSKGREKWSRKSITLALWQIMHCEMADLRKMNIATFVMVRKILRCIIPIILNH